MECNRPARMESAFQQLAKNLTFQMRSNTDNTGIE